MKLGLGTAQFGMDYGISNHEGKTTREEASAILHLALDHGIDMIDTAPGYGDSEAVLGAILPADHRFKIITKTPGFPGRPVAPKDAEVLQRALRDSLARLRCRSIYGILAHSADDLLAPGGDLLFKALNDLKDEGSVSKIGVSVYTGEQIDQILARYEVDVVQLPISVLDTRLHASGRLKELKRRKVEVHARSIFLQGLLLMDPEKMHRYFDPAKPVLRSYHAFLQDNGLTPIEGAFCFIKRITEIDRVVIGVNSREQLQVNYQAFVKEYDARLFCRQDVFSLDDPRFLNPALWRVREA